MTTKGKMFKNRVWRAFPYFFVEFSCFPGGRTELIVSYNFFPYFEPEASLSLPSGQIRKTR